MHNDVKQKLLWAIKEKRPETTRQLIKAVLDEDSSLSGEEIMDELLNLEKEGLIVFNEPQAGTRENRSKFMIVSRAYWFWITVSFSFVTATVVFAVSTDAFPLVLVRYFLGTVFVLFLPGYAVTRAAFPSEQPLKRAEKSIELLERVALSFGVSVAIVPVVALLVSYTPLGLQQASVTLGLLLFTLACSVVAMIREYRARR